MKREEGGSLNFKLLIVSVVTEIMDAFIFPLQHTYFIHSVAGCVQSPHLCSFSVL